MSEHDSLSAAPAPSLYESIVRAGFEASAPARVRASAAVVPWRRRDGRIEVYWVRRSPTMAFMGGWWAFPGGGLSRRDAPVPVHGTPAGTSAAQRTPSAPGLDARELEHLGPDLVPGLLACTLRELFEETGLLLASELDAQTLAGDRRRLLAKEVDLAALLDERGWRLDASSLVFAGRWLTPPFAPMRFDNRFFLLEWPADRPLQPSLEGRELDRGEWIEPAVALDRWEAEEMLAAPPILHILKVLATDGPEEGHERLVHTDEADLGPFRRIEFRPGVILLPLRTPTLPPATSTNAFLLGRRQAVLVDPATPLADEQARLLAALDAASDQGLELQAIWLTHHHPDHVGAVEVVRRRWQVPVLAHPATARILEAQGMAIDGALDDGQEIVLDGEPALRIRVHHTPGHARGHLCFFEQRSRTLIAGDLISTLSTIVIDPPDGDMDDYLRSLERMAALDPFCLFPSHGPGALDPVAKLEQYREHRLAREAKVLAAHRAGRTTPEAMVAEVYDDADPRVHPIAQRQIQAHLDRLRRLGEI